MIKEQVKSKYGWIVFRYKRESWVELFRVELLDGECLPYFLPVERSAMKATTIWWVWYLLPIVLPARILKEILIKIYKDLRQTLRDYKELNIK